MLREIPYLPKSSEIIFAGSMHMTAVTAFAASKVKKSINTSYVPSKPVSTGRGFPIIGISRASPQRSFDHITFL